jgi:hypothetical protein
MKEATEEARATEGYYAGDPAAREAFEEAAVAAVEATRATLTAAWVEANAPDAGTEGGACSASAPCTVEPLCCGTATPTSNAVGVTTGEITGICADKTYTDGLAREYGHVCAAKALLASATAIFAAALLL